MQVHIVKGFDKTHFAVIGKLEDDTENKIRLLIKKNELKRKDTAHGWAILIPNARKEVIDLLKLKYRAVEHSSLDPFEKSRKPPQIKVDSDEEDEDYEVDEEEESDEEESDEDEEESEKAPEPAKKAPAKKAPVKKDAPKKSPAKAKAVDITVIRDYTEKSFAVYGDTKPYLEKIKEVNGRVGA